MLLQQIFDIKFQIENGTQNKAASIEHQFVEEGQELTISAIVDSPIIPLRKADLYISTLGDTAEPAIIPMNITALPLPGSLNSTSIVTGIIPEELLKAPAVEFWIRLVTEEGLVLESTHTILGVKPESVPISASIEMDTQTIKAQGTTIRPTAYVTNEADIPVYGTISLLVDGKKVTTKQTLFQSGQSIVGLQWSIPKTDTATSYKLQTLTEIYDKSYITSEATLDTFVRTQIVPLSENIKPIIPITDELGNSIARPALLYASNPGEGRFQITAPDGTCVIGSGEDCMVQDSTLSNRGALDSVILDGQIYRIRYSGADSPLERFSITSFDPVIGDWKVQIVSEDSILPLASADSDVSLKIKYRAERSPLITVTSILLDNEILEQNTTTLLEQKSVDRDNTSLNQTESEKGLSLSLIHI